MQTDNEKVEKTFIKIPNYETAEALSRCGFLYMKEKINHNQELYVFERTKELEDVLYSMHPEGCFNEHYVVEDCGLYF
jgi:hypothetical protein